ncbi:MAG: hypothetical protein M3406_13470 [Chloroflexota bacterium]|nr:hypothetical protein [Chloroflexota bacterium]
MLGDSGTGKSHILIGLVQRAPSRDATCAMSPPPRMANELAEAAEGGT